MILLRESPTVEEGKLKHDRTKFWSKNVHRFHELFEFRIAVNQCFFMRNDLRNFDGKYEVVRSSGGPIVDRARRRTSVERRVHFDRSELRGVVGKEIA